MSSRDLRSASPGWSWFLFLSLLVPSGALRAAEGRSEPAFAWPPRGSSSLTCGPASGAANALAEDVANHPGATVCSAPNGVLLSFHVSDLSTATEAFTAGDLLSFALPPPGTWKTERTETRTALLSKHWPDLSIVAEGIDGAYVRHVVRGDGVGFDARGAKWTGAVWVQVPVVFQIRRTGEVIHQIVVLQGRVEAPQDRLQRPKVLEALDAAVKGIVASLKPDDSRIAILDARDYAKARQTNGKLPPRASARRLEDVPQVEKVVVESLGRPGVPCEFLWEATPAGGGLLAWDFHVDGRVVATVEAGRVGRLRQFQTDASPCRPGRHRVKVVARESKDGPVLKESDLLEVVFPPVAPEIRAAAAIVSKRLVAVLVDVDAKAIEPGTKVEWRVSATEAGPYLPAGEPEQILPGILLLDLSNVKIGVRGGPLWVRAVTSAEGETSSSRPAVARILEKR